MQHRRDVVAASVLWALASWAGAQSYHAVALPQGTAVRMSSCGWVTGNAGDSAFTYHDGQFQLLSSESYGISALSINNYGDIAGYTWGGKPGATTVAIVFPYGADGAHGIHKLGLAGSIGTGINDADVATGVVQTPASNPVKDVPFISWNGKTITLERKSSQLLSGINNSNQVVGTERGRARLQAFVYANRSYTDVTVTGATSTAGNAINDAGNVVGYGITPSGSSQGFMYADGVGTFIGPAPGAYNQANNLLALNNVGQAVGYITNASGATHALLYAAGGFTDLNDVSDAPEPLVSAVGISDSGVIVALVASGGSYLLLPGGVYPPNTCKTR